jgi:hypothetical protein
MRWPVALIALLLVVYVGTYYRLSRRGMAEVRGTNAFFFYCPLADLTPYEDLPWQHRISLVLFDPINQLDQAWFNGQSPCRGVTWGLSR